MDLDVRIYDEVNEDSIKFAVIVARHAGQLVLCRHAERETWEIPGGHRESGESALEAAKRELREETGALDFELELVSYYSVIGANRANTSGEEAFGALFRAEIATFGDIHSEIAEIAFMDTLPHDLTYPEIQPLLLAKADGLSIREAREEDFASVISLYRQLKPSKEFEMNLYQQEAWEEMLSDPKHHLIIAEKNEKPVATCALTIIPGLTHGGSPYAVIENVVTDASYRRQGVMRTCLGYAKSLARDAGCYKVFLTTRLDNDASQALYASCGFSGDCRKAFVCWL